MNARASENYLAISRSSSASKGVEIIWAEIYWGRLFFRAESSLIQSSCRSFMNESYGSVNSHGLWACANILTPKTGTDQTRNTIALFWYS